MSLRMNKAIAEKIKNGVVVRGTGIHSARCTYMFQLSGIDIVCYIDRNGGNTFRGKPVYGVDFMPDKEMLLVVATNMDIYPTIASELRERGLVEFVNFAYYEWFIKDIVLLHGNCHMEILKEYLLSSREFTHKYSIYPYPLLISSTKEFRTEPEIFENIDIWVHEDIRNNNSFGYEVSDEYIRSNLGEAVREIKIPHLYGISRMFFPQVITLNDNGNEALNGGTDTDGIFLYGDSVIEDCVNKGMNTDEIISFCMGDMAIPEEEVLTNYESSINKVRSREALWDIKIADFIEENYRKDKLFYDPGHPTNVVMEYIAREVLLILGITPNELICNKRMDAHEKCVYPCVRKLLGIIWDEDDVRKTGKKLGDYMDFPEFIREYLWWRHYEKYKKQIKMD